MEFLFEFDIFQKLEIVNTGLAYAEGKPWKNENIIQFLKAKRLELMQDSNKIAEGPVIEMFDGTSSQTINAAKGKRSMADDLDQILREGKQVNLVYC